MIPAEQHIRITRHARYFTLGDAAAANDIWIVCHGYAQLARKFIDNFTPIAQSGRIIVAPEGLHRFYLDPPPAPASQRRVGATWMTRENRLSDIENYLTFLNSIYAREMTDSSIPVTVFGFSQGAATASRWVLDGKIDFSRLILWAGILPPDMNFESGKEILQNKKVVLAYGKKDPFLSDDRFTEMQALSSTLNITAETITFNGGHEIDQETLIKLI